MDLAREDDALLAAGRSRRLWLIIALVASLCLHLGLVLAFKNTYLPQFSVQPTERLSPPPMTVKQVEINPELLEDPAQSPDVSSPKKQDKVPDIILPKEEDAFEKLLNREIRATPAAPDLARALAEQQPAPTESTELSDRLDADSARELAKSLQSMSRSLSTQQPVIQPGSLTKGMSDDLAKSAAALAADSGGYSDLDGLLAQAGRLRAGTAPILMPTDLLFDYDSAGMRPGAEQSLGKLAALIAKNPGTVFVIEGHSDAFGSPEYNMQLSQMRAESVKQAVVQLAGVPASQILTRGYGSTRLIAPATGSVEEQQINRRVEIVIKAAR